MEKWSKMSFSFQHLCSYDLTALYKSIIIIIIIYYYY